MKSWIELKIAADWHRAATHIAGWQMLGQQVVFTNGCFDLLHYGHFQYLTEARSLGNKLVVGINADASVRRLKGNSRPILDERARLFAMASLLVVDMVVLFEQDTPLDLITTLHPDILVKGGDYTPDQIVGADAVLARGGQVRSLPFVEGYSTTAMLTKQNDL